jgi:hypothetical protein
MTSSKKIVIPSKRGQTAEFPVADIHSPSVIPSKRCANASREMEPSLVIISFPNVVFVMVSRLLLEGSRGVVTHVWNDELCSRHSIQAMRECIARDGTQLGHHQLPQRRLRDGLKTIVGGK